MPKRHGPGNVLCPVCDVSDIGAHILFSCIVTEAFWSFVREALGPNWEALYLVKFLEARATHPGQQRCLFWLIFMAMS